MLPTTSFNSLYAGRTLCSPCVVHLSFHLQPPVHRFLVSSTILISSNLSWQGPQKLKIIKHSSDQNITCNILQRLSEGCVELEVYSVFSFQKGDVCHVLLTANISGSHFTFKTITSIVCLFRRLSSLPRVKVPSSATHTIESHDPGLDLLIYFWEVKKYLSFICL